MYYVYILKNSNDIFYVGHSNNLNRRLREHASGKGAKFTHDVSGMKLMYVEEFELRSEAMKREQQLKKWTKAKKFALISGNIEKLHQLSKNHQNT